MQRPQTLSERPAARPPRHHPLRRCFAAPHPRPLLQMLTALMGPGCHIHIRNSSCAQAQHLLLEDGEPNVCGGEQQLQCAVENTNPRRSFPSDGFTDLVQELHLDLRCFSFHHELLQLGEQALTPTCLEIDTLGQRPTMGVTHICGDRFFLTQGHLRERGRFACTCVRCLAFSVCAVWEHGGCEDCVSVAVSASMPTRLCLFVSCLCLCSLDLCDGVVRRGLQ